MESMFADTPGWLSAYWVGVTVLRLALMLFVLWVVSRRLSIQPVSARLAALWVPGLVLNLWVAVVIVLGSRNLLRIHEGVALPPPIGAAVLAPVLVGFVAFQYWAPFRRLVFAIPQHWLIALQAYRMTGSVFLVLYAMGLVPGVFALPSGIGDLALGAAALPVAYFCYRRMPWADRAAMVWNYLGLAQLILLVLLGLLSAPSPIQTLALDNPNLITSVWPSVLAPAFHVPLGILLHIFSLAQLRRESPTPAPATPRRIGWQLMMAGAVTIFAYSALFYIMTPLLTPRPVAGQVYPGLGAVLQAHVWALYLHVIPAMGSLILGPFQFLPQVRSNWPDLHRWLGRIYLVTVVVGGVAALYLAQFSFMGMSSRLGFSVLALLLLYTGYRAYANIRQRRVQGHREWMMRNYALIFAAVTLRIYIRIFFGMGYTLPDIHGINAWLCWVPNLIFVEWLIRRGRNQRREAPRPAPAMGAPS